MVQISTNNDNKDNNNNSNIDSIYSYFEWYIETRTNLFYKIEARILAALAFSGVSLKIIADPPKPEELFVNKDLFCYSCIFLRLLSFIAIIIAIIIGSPEYCV